MPFKLKDIAAKCVSSESVINWLISIGLLINLSGCVCKSCVFVHFGLRKDTCYSSDGYVWRCSNKKCHKKVSVRKGWWFANHNLTLEKIVYITYFWVYRCNQEFVCHEIEICQNPIVDWYNYAREVCTEILCKSENNIVGGRTWNYR